LNNGYQGLVDQIKSELDGVKNKIDKQKAQDEKAKLKKLQEEMEREKRRKEAEEAELRRQEAERKWKAEEEERRRKQEEADKRQAEKLQQDLDNANNRIALQMEQERRDHELALRLAEETGGGVEEMHTLKRSSLVNAQREAEANAKYNLSKWKYAELRDTINTSCEIELLEACREEFHRRLKVYHAWKARNKRKETTFDEGMRAPNCILKEGNRPTMSGVKKPSATGTHRYFKIPFLQEVISAPGQNNNNQRGLWYAHFDGDWICRQMEIHPGREPILLLAGKDDMQMCELRLDETGLACKRGAEISAHEFEAEWNKNGGKR